MELLQEIYAVQRRIKWYEDNFKRRKKTDLDYEELIEENQQLLIQLKAAYHSKNQDQYSK